MSIDIFEGTLQEERDSFSLGETKEMVSSADGVLLHASISTKYPRGWLQSFPALVCNSSAFSKHQFIKLHSIYYPEKDKKWR